MAEEERRSAVRTTGLAVLFTGSALLMFGGLSLLGITPLFLRWFAIPVPFLTIPLGAFLLALGDTL